jgi:hypothetical protein
MWQAFLPIGRDELGFFANRIDVISQRKRDHISFQTIDHGPRLLARTAVGLLDGERIARLGFPVFRKSGVEFLIQLARRVIRHIEQRNVCCMGCAGSE